MPDDSYLVTVGENDYAILIWAYKAASSQTNTPIHQEESKDSPLNISLNTRKQNIIKDAELNESLEQLQETKG